MFSLQKIIKQIIKSLQKGLNLALFQYNCDVSRNPSTAILKFRYLEGLKKGIFLSALHIFTANKRSMFC